MYYPLQDRLRYPDADMELVGVFYEILADDICWQPEWWDYRTALHRSRVDLMAAYWDNRKKEKLK